MHLVELLQVPALLALLPSWHDALVRVPAQHQWARDPVMSKLSMGER